jgi:hypothetical protein
MAELKLAGYQSLRNFVNSSVPIPNEWDYIEVYDDTGSAVTRVSITNDSRCQWLDDDGDNILKIRFNITGSDSDIPLPTQIEKSAIWDAATGGNQISQKESFATSIISVSADTVTITHSIKLPQ